MTDVDYRGLTALFWRHVAPYGEVRLNMTTRLPCRRRPEGPERRHVRTTATADTNTSRSEAGERLFAGSLRESRRALAISAFLCFAD
jgi:hypothetical protein